MKLVEHERAQRSSAALKFMWNYHTTTAKKTLKICFFLPLTFYTAGIAIVPRLHVFDLLPELIGLYAVLFSAVSFDIIVDLIHRPSDGE